MFAAYANLNVLQVSPIFARNYTMRTCLASLPEFPWLSEEEAVRQRAYVEWHGGKAEEEPPLPRFPR